MNAKTRYARNGDLHIAYQVVGDGPIDLVFIPGFVSHVEWFWENPAWEQIFARLTGFSRLILWDKRGVGLSDPVVSVPTLEERVSDLEAVLAAVGSERIAIFGISEGGPMGLLYAALHPERVSAVVLYGASPRFVATDDWAWGWSPTEYGQIIEEVEAGWGDGALLATLAPSLAGNDAAREIVGLRRQLERFRGREVKVTGDGFVATFDGPARAIQCAQSITAAVRPLGLEVRAGLHTGEIELRGEDIAGVAVHIGARVAALAGPGEVLP